MASVETAEQNIDRIAPHVRFGGTTIAPEKLAVDMWFLRENIRELSVLPPK
jgi:hypothetical protein